LMGVAVLASPLGALSGRPGVELKLEASKTAEIDSRVTERATLSAQALVELFCCFFMELFRLDYLQDRTNPVYCALNYCDFLVTLIRLSCYIHEKFLLHDR
jgi:hypothetical protein